MKKIFLLTFAFVASLSLSAQITEGKITYSMTVSSDDPDMAMASAMMAGSKMIMYFSGDKSRTEMDMGSVKSTTITDYTAGKTITLQDAMGMKMATEIMIDKTPVVDTEEAFKIENTKETKEIMGYKCKKAILTMTEVTEMEPIVVWYTSEISTNFYGQSMFAKEVPGFPLEYQMDFGGMKMIFVAESFEKGVDKKLFDLTIPEGYEIQNLEELMEGEE